MTEPEDALGRALASYAQLTSGNTLDANSVRSRVLHQSVVPRGRSLRGYSLALPLVATLAASAALAASHAPARGVVAAWVRAWLGASGVPQARPSAPGSKVVGAPSSATTAPSASPAGEGPSAPILVGDLPLAEPASAADPDEVRVRRSVGMPAGTVFREIDVQLNAYQAAHRTHFDASNPAAALAAWDHYLANFPAGSFAMDARFNRALCLIRLGRLAEGRSALTPFATAVSGSYRQVEAIALLRSLDQGVSGSPP